MTVENITPAVDWFTVYALPIVVAVTTAAGVIVSVVTYIFEKRKFRSSEEAEEKKLRLTGLAEVFRLLNDVKHREARKVLYDIDERRPIRESSYNIIGIKEVTSDEASNQEALKDICSHIIRNDFNE